MKKLRGYNAGKEKIPEAVKGNPAFMSAMSKYGGLSEDALVGKLLEQIRASHENGTYNPGQMQSYVSMLSPYLSAAQREKLGNIMKVIENEKI